MQIFFNIFQPYTLLADNLNPSAITISPAFLADNLGLTIPFSYTSQKTSPKCSGYNLLIIAILGYKLAQLIFIQIYYHSSYYLEYL